MVDWHPRRLVKGTEWTMAVPGQPEPIAVIRRLRFEGRAVYRAVTWAPTSAGRELIGYYRSGDAAAVAVWRRYVAQQEARHDAASRMHGGRERG
ncbi:hypothetical protein [Amnibacterium sp.]|uniref:hypothetical protein n=1 Tax=Amnibacterium sp. TaxID=1872496 RepID=UPI003F7C0589